MLSSVPNAPMLAYPAGCRTLCIFRKYPRCPAILHMVAAVGLLFEA